MSPGRPGTRVLQPMNGVFPGRSRILPLTDFVNIVLNKNRFMWDLEHSNKQKNTDGANSGRKEPVITPQGITQTMEFSPVGDKNAALSMLATQSPLDELSVTEPNSQLNSLTYDMLTAGDSPPNHSQQLSPSQTIINGVPSFQVSDEINNRRKQPEVKDVSCDYLIICVIIRCS